MSGHSKWSTIKHKKGAVDEKRGKLFNKLSRELMVAARLGGADPESNGRLRLAMNKARAANMPKDTVERAIKKGSGDLEGAVMEEIRYEVYAPGGIGIIVDALTDKKSRTTPEVKSILNKHNCNLAESGAVSRLFELRGDIVIARGDAEEEELMELVLDAGADDMETFDDYYQIYTRPENFEAVQEAVAGREIPTQVAEVHYVAMPGTEVEVESAEQAARIIKLVEIFDDHDDIQEVFHNMSVSDEVMEQVDAL